MGANVITNAEEAYEKAMSNPSPMMGLIVVIVTGLVFGGALYLIAPLPQLFAIAIIANVIQWIVLSAVLWGLYVMFKEKKMGDMGFAQIASATGKLWTLVLLLYVILLIGMLLSGLAGLAAWGLTVIVGALALYSHYKLIKVMLSSNKGRHIIVWFVSLIITGLVMAIIIALINSLIRM